MCRITVGNQMTLSDWLSEDFIDETCRLNCSHEGKCRGDTLLSLRLFAGIQVNLNSCNKSRGRNFVPATKFFLNGHGGICP